MQLSDYLWLDEINPISRKKIDLIESSLAIKFPIYFKEMISQYDGCSPKKSDFKYFDVYSQDEIISGIGSFIPLKNRGYSDVYLLYKNPPEFFPKGLIAFADTGNGDLICFDYRNDPKTDNPPIVYWNHEADIGKDVSFVAKDFEEFLLLLHEPDDKLGSSAQRYVKYHRI